MDINKALEEATKEGWMSLKPSSLTDKEIVQYLQQIDKPNGFPIVLPADHKRIIFTSLDQIESIEVWLERKIISVVVKNIGKVSVPDNEHYRTMLGIDADLLTNE